MSMMDIIRQRHSVRSYEHRAIEGEIRERLDREIAICARRGDLDIQLVSDNPEVFGLICNAGLIHGARDHIAFVTRDDHADEAIGYWGQRIVLRAQQLGLNTCWVAMIARGKSRAAHGDDERVRIAIAVGYGKTAGKLRRSKPIEELSSFEGGGEMPAWFLTAMEAAQLAPTAINAQRFHITLRADRRTVAIEASKGAWTRIDLGIVRCNFETAANETGAEWAWE